MTNEELGELIRNAIGEAMTSGVAKNLVIPLAVKGRPNLIARAVVELPTAIEFVTRFNDDGSFRREVIHGKWDAEKQQIEWDK